MSKKQRQINDKDLEIESLLQKIRTVENSKKKINGEKDDLQNTIEILNSQVANIPGMERKFERDMNALRDQITALTAGKDASDSNTREAEKRAFSYKQKVEEYEMEIETFKRENRRLLGEVDELTNNAADKGELTQQLNKNRNLQDQINELKEQADEDNELIYKLEREKDALQGELMKERNDKNSLQGEIEDIEDGHNSRYNRIKTELANQTMEFDNIKIKYNNAQSKITTLNGDLEESNSRLEGVENHLANQMNAMEAIKRRLAEADAETLTLREFRARYEETKKKLDEVERRLGGDLANHTDEIDKLKKKVNNQRLELEDKDDEIEDISSNLANARNAKSQAENKMNDIQMRYDELEIDYNKAKSDRDILTNQYNDKSRQLEDRNEELEESENEKSKLRQQYNTLQAELEDATGNVKRTMQRKIDIITAERNTLEEESNTMKTSMARFESDLDRLRTFG